MSANVTRLESITDHLTEFDLIKVPVYQRSYSWERAYVDVFWNDIMESLNEGRESYFIGSIITKNIDDKKVELIDGQQRITTSLMLLSIIRRFFGKEQGKTSKQGYLKHYHSLMRRFVNEDSILGDDGAAIYQMNTENSPIYRDHVLADTDINEIRVAFNGLKSRESNYLMLDAILYLWDAVDSYCCNEFNEQKLLDLAKFVLSSLRVLNIRVDDEADAFLIFETINDRGRELDTMDLVKNLLFSSAKRNDFDSIKTNWIKTIEQLGDLNNYSDFLHQFWTARNGEYIRTNLYKLIKEYIKDDKQNVVEFSESIYEAARVYSAIGTLDEDFWNVYPTNTLANLRILKLLGAKAINPILMTAINYLTEEEYGKLTGYLVTLQVRYVLVSGFHTSKYAKAMAKIPPLFEQHSWRKAIKVASELKKLGVYVNDDTFKEKFIIYSEKTAKKARYILSELETYIAGADKTVNRDTKNVNVEHIMPQTRGEGWTVKATLIDNDEYDYWVYRIGNQCLLNTKLNKELKNAAFKVKVAKLKESKMTFDTTKGILEFKGWDKESITERQKTLAEFVPKIWSIPYQN